MNGNPQAQAETTATATPEKTGADNKKPNLENLSLEDLDSVQTQAAEVVSSHRKAGSGEGDQKPPGITEGPEKPTFEAPKGDDKPPVKEPEKPAEEVKPVEPEKPAEPAKPAEPKTEPEPSGEIPERFRFKDPTDRAIAAVKKAADVAGKPITWAQAETAVRGVATPDAAVQVDPVAEASTAIDTLKGEIGALEAQINPESEDEILSTKESRAATVKLAEKRAELVRTEIKLDQVKAEQEAQKETLRSKQRAARDKSKARAIEQFSDAADETTVLGQAIKKRFDEMKDPNHPDHPILYADTAPERVTEIVAKELGIAPKANPPVKPTETKPAAQPQAKATPVSGAKTAVPEKPAEAKDDKKSVDYLRSDKASLADLDEAMGANVGMAAAVR